MSWHRKLLKPPGGGERLGQGGADFTALMSKLEVLEVAGALVPRAILGVAAVGLPCLEVDAGMCGCWCQPCGAFHPARVLFLAERMNPWTMCGRSR